MLRCVMLGLVLLPGLALGQAKPPAAGAPAGQPALSIRNGTPHVITNVYVSLASQSDWGRDQLGQSETLGAGATRAFSLPPGECLYDIRILYQGGIAEERRRINACQEQSLELPLAAQRLPR